MTLILTQISKHGIIHASDSSLTRTRGYDASSAGDAKKTFELPFLQAGLTVAGAFSVHEERMDDWMDRFILMQSQVPSLRLSTFAHNLSRALQDEMLDEEKKDPCLIHIAGYVQEGNEYHPEFWFVRNALSIDSNGEYADIGEEFVVEEQFWKRDWAKVHSTFQFGNSWQYFNGFPAGRVSYIVIQDVLNPALEYIWAQADWKFRRPNSLSESEEFATLYLRFIGALFNSSDYDVPYIGGKIQCYSIPAPKQEFTD